MNNVYPSYPPSHLETTYPLYVNLISRLSTRISLLYIAYVSLKPSVSIVQSEHPSTIYDILSLC